MLADLIVHVVDASEPEHRRRESIAAVDSVLEEIGAGTAPRLLVFNKIDLLDADEARELAIREPEAIAISAASGDGLDGLRRRGSGRRSRRHCGRSSCCCPYSEGSGLAELHEPRGRPRARGPPRGGRGQGPGSRRRWRTGSRTFPETASDPARAVGQRRLADASGDRRRDRRHALRSRRRRRGIPRTQWANRVRPGHQSHFRSGDLHDEAERQRRTQADRRHESRVLGEWAADRLLWRIATATRRSSRSGRTGPTDANSLTTVGVNDIDPAFSPNGRQIVFSRNLPGGYEIFKMRSDGTHQRQLTHDSTGRGVVGATFSPSGRQIAYVQRDFRPFPENRGVFRHETGRDPPALHRSRRQPGLLPVWAAHRGRYNRPGGY